MLIPHLHFRGNCKEALSFYENAFNVKADTVIFRKDYDSMDRPNENEIAHAVMHIHYQRVYLNDRFGKKTRRRILPFIWLLRLRIRMICFLAMKNERRKYHRRSFGSTAV